MPTPPTVPPRDLPTGTLDPRDEPTARCLEPAARTHARSLIGVEVGRRYVLERLLGVGGMGAVYAARHRDLGAPVAIKVLQSTAATDRLRFVREARRAAALRHRGVVRVFDYQIDPDVGAYLVMERLEGETLAARLRRAGPLPRELAIDVVRRVLDALHYIHGAGLVHRDLKPANVFLAGDPDDPEPKVLDFGIARAIAPRQGESLTLPGTVVGTLRYMAPEQACGVRAVDARADVYAAGALLLTALTGRPPYLERGHELLVAMRRNDPARLADFATGCDARLCAAVDRAMARAPEDRFASALAFRDALGPRRPRGLRACTTRVGWGALPGATGPAGRLRLSSVG